MKKAQTEQVPQAKPEPKLIEVRAPIVRLQTEDLVYLKGLAGKGPCCTMGYKRVYKLKLLGLVEDKEVQPTAKVQKDYQRTLGKLVSQMSAALDKYDWDALRNLAYQAQREKPGAVKKTVVTESGLKILTAGIVTVVVPKRC